MVDFVSAQKLKKNFSVYGSFYKIYISNNDNIKCRNNLEIFDKNYFTDLKECRGQYSKKPDALVIMMNPGSSSPSSKLKNYLEPRYKMNGLASNILSNHMVLAKPDTTQYQIMRIMISQNWKYIRIVNLSDIRESDSNNFFQIARNFETKYKSQIHSIFSKKREKERIMAFSIEKNDPILLAWGCNKLQGELAKRAIELINHPRIIGLNLTSKIIST